MSETEQPRGYTVNFPVTHLGWRSLAIEFTPARSGTVTLTLMGPWEEASKGVLYRRGSPLGRHASVEGARLARRWVRIGQAASRAAAGRAAVGPSSARRRMSPPSRDRTMREPGTTRRSSRRLQVAGGQPVTIRSTARAVRPAGFREMKRIDGRSTPATRPPSASSAEPTWPTAWKLPPGQDWGGHYTAADLRLIQHEGFDHVRIPIGWHHYTGPGTGVPHSSPRSSPGLMTSSTPDCARGSASSSTSTTSTISPPTPRSRRRGSWRSGASSPSITPSRRRDWPSSS